MGRLRIARTESPDLDYPLRMVRPATRGSGAGRDLLEPTFLLIRSPGARLLRNAEDFQSRSKVANGKSSCTCPLRILGACYSPTMFNIISGYTSGSEAKLWLDIADTSCYSPKSMRACRQLLSGLTYSCRERDLLAAQRHPTVPRRCQLELHFVDARHLRGRSPGLAVVGSHSVRYHAYASCYICLAVSQS